jgi:molybdopterin-guanine dinucleotide biosynthesis protein A
MLPKTAAVILAGGRGERLGGTVKANIEIGGIRLIERVLGMLEGARPVLVARGDFSDAELALPLGTIAVADTGGGGPLAGVAGAVEWLQAQPDVPSFLLSVAVDTPFLPRDFLAASLARIGKADAVVAQFDGQDYPTNALWRIAAVRSAISEVSSLKGLIAAVSSRVLDWTSRGGENPFANVNTPDELAALERRAAAQFPVGKAEQTG